MHYSADLELKLRSGDAESLPALPRDSLERLEKLMWFCPVYRSLLRRRPALALWLETPDVRDVVFQPSTFRDSWLRDYKPESQEREDQVLALQRFRRAMSMRIAYRELNGVSTIQDSFLELSFLAEFCVAEALRITEELLQRRFGQPWDDDADQPGRFTVLGLGKLGGRELNFVSDLDLIYVYDVRGFTRKNGRKTQFSNEEYFYRLARDLTNLLQDRSNEGFLYNIDLRLRPEGASGPVARSLAGMEHYYYEAGQTWERVALMKARCVAGDRSLADEVLEVLAAFRFPRMPPAGLFEEVAGLKLRIEKENLRNGGLERDIKNGYGGIREIEFIAQALQLVHGGRNPFLQSPGTMVALDGLVRYELLTSAEADFLREAYIFLRTVEHRLQMREEAQTQMLPEPGVDFDALAQSMDLDAAALQDRLAKLRDRVRGEYARRFPLSSREEKIQEWISFLSGGEPSADIHDTLRSLFWGPLGPVLEGMRMLARGNSANIVTREQVTLMMELVNVMPEVLRPLAHPLRTLGRVNSFADVYGARKRFLRMCAANPSFFRAICLLFDRSQFIHQLLCSHPEIFEELLLSGGIRLNKSGTLIRQEIHGLRQDNDEQLAKSLWLYVQAEQVRIAIAQVLTGSEAMMAERALSRLASVVLNEVLHIVDPQGDLAIVAMGKFAGRELSFGSDLDVMFVTAGAGCEDYERRVRRFLKILAFRGKTGPTFEIDTRLRPHGQDGPLVVSMPALRHYHATSAQLWEKQALIRSRSLSDRTGSRSIRDKTSREFDAFRVETVFETPPPPDLFEQISRMRLKIEKEKVKSEQPQRAFKAGPGGLLDIEFLCQALQLKHGGTLLKLRSPNTRDTLRSLTAASVLSQQEGILLLDNYNFIRKLEFKLRRQDNKPVTDIDDNSDLQHSIATWMGFPHFDSFWDELCRRMSQNRTFFNRFLLGA